MNIRHATRIDRAAHPTYPALHMKTGDFLQSQIRKIAYALRASDAFPQLLGLERGKSAAFPCEVLALALKAVGTECRPYQNLSPMAGIVTSQPMSKITLRRMFPLEHRYYTTKPLRIEW